VNSDSDKKSENFTNKSNTMSDLIKKTLLAVVGAMEFTREKAEEITKDLINKGEVAKSDEAKFVRELMDWAAKNTAAMEEKVEKTVTKIMAKLDIPTRKEINDLKEEIRKLNKKGKGTGTN